MKLKDFIKAIDEQEVIKMKLNHKIIGIRLKVFNVEREAYDWFDVPLDIVKQKKAFYEEVKKNNYASEELIPYNGMYVTQSEIDNQWAIGTVETVEQMVSLLTGTYDTSQFNNLKVTASQLMDNGVMAYGLTKTTTGEMEGIFESDLKKALIMGIKVEGAYIENNELKVDLPIESVTPEDSYVEEENEYAYSDDIEYEDDYIEEDYEDDYEDDYIEEDYEDDYDDVEYAEEEDVEIEDNLADFDFEDEEDTQDESEEGYYDDETDIMYDFFDLQDALNRTSTHIKDKDTVLEDDEKEKAGGFTIIAKQNLLNSDSVKNNQLLSIYKKYYLWRSRQIWNNTLTKKHIDDEGFVIRQHAKDKKYIEMKEKQLKAIREANGGQHNWAYAGELYVGMEPPAYFREYKVWNKVRTTHSEYRYRKNPDTNKYERYRAQNLPGTYVNGVQCRMDHNCKYVHLVWDTEVCPIDDDVIYGKFASMTPWELHNALMSPEYSHIIAMGETCTEDFFEVPAWMLALLKSVHNEMAVESKKIADIYIEDRDKGTTWVQNNIDSFAQMDDIVNKVMKYEMTAWSGTEYKQGYTEALPHWLMVTYTELRANNLYIPPSMIHSIRDTLLGWYPKSFTYSKGYLRAPATGKYWFLDSFGNNLTKLYGSNYDAGKYVDREVREHSLQKDHNSSKEFVLDDIYGLGSVACIIRYLYHKMAYEPCGVFSFLESEQPVRNNSNGEVVKNNYEGGNNEKIRTAWGSHKETCKGVKSYLGSLDNIGDILAIIGLMYSDDFYLADKNKYSSLQYIEPFTRNTFYNRQNEQIPSDVIDMLKKDREVYQTEVDAIKEYLQNYGGYVLYPEKNLMFTRARMTELPSIWKSYKVNLDLVNKANNYAKAGDIDAFISENGQEIRGSIVSDSFSKMVLIGAVNKPNDPKGPTLIALKMDKHFRGGYNPSRIVGMNDKDIVTTGYSYHHSGNEYLMILDTLIEADSDKFLNHRELLSLLGSEHLGLNDVVCLYDIKLDTSLSDYVNIDKLMESRLDYFGASATDFKEESINNKAILSFRIELLLDDKMDEVDTRNYVNGLVQAVKPEGCSIYDTKLVEAEEVQTEEVGENVENDTSLTEYKLATIENAVFTVPVADDFFDADFLNNDGAIREGVLEFFDMQKDCPDGISEGFIITEKKNEYQLMVFDTDSNKYIPEGNEADADCRLYKVKVKGTITIQVPPTLPLSGVEGYLRNKVGCETYDDTYIYFSKGTEKISTKDLKDSVKWCADKFKLLIATDEFKYRMVGMLIDDGDVSDGRLPYVAQAYEEALGVKTGLDDLMSKAKTKQWEELKDDEKEALEWYVNGNADDSKTESICKSALSRNSYTEKMKKYIDTVIDKYTVNAKTSQSSNAVPTPTRTGTPEGLGSISDEGESFATFISNGNAILVTNESEFNKFVEFLTKFNMVSILGKYTTFNQWIDLARTNNMKEDVFLFEYQRGKGISWSDDIQKSIRWYGVEPIKLP